jgi:hypothetical protein
MKISEGLYVNIKVTIFTHIFRPVPLVTSIASAATQASVAPPSLSLPASRAPSPHPTPFSAADVAAAELAGGVKGASRAVVRDGKGWY